MVPDASDLAGPDSSAVSDHPTISPVWLDWLRDFQPAGQEAIREITVEPADRGDEESQSLRCALFARMLTLLGTACLLAQHDKQLDLRGCCRGLVECALHMAGGDNDPVYAEKLKDDDMASRRSRAKAFRHRSNNADDESLRLLDDFLGRDFGNIKRLEISDLSEGSQFPRLIHAFREISADTLHVTWTSLLRHCVDDCAGITVCMIDPPLSAEDLHDTLTLIAISALICTMILARNVPNGDGIVEKFANLQARYQALRRGADYRATPCN